MLGRVANFFLCTLKGVYPDTRKVLLSPPKKKKSEKDSPVETVEVEVVGPKSTVEVDVVAPDDEQLPALMKRSDGDLALYIRDMKRYSVLSREDEQILAKQWFETQDPEVFRMLVQSNLRFVVKIANEYKRYGFRIQDLIQEGNVGLIKAVMKFNPHRGYRLISYAVWWIRAQIHDYILKNWSMVKIGTTQLQRKMFYRLQSAQTTLKARLEDEATPEEREQMAIEFIAEDLETDVNTVAEFRARMQRRDMSMDTPLSEDGEVTLENRLHAEVVEHEENIGDRQEHSVLHEVLTVVRESLNERDIYILEHRILSDEPETLDTIGDHFGVSKERIRQLENRVRQKIVEAGRTHFAGSKLLPSSTD